MSLDKLSPEDLRSKISWALNQNTPQKDLEGWTMEALWEEFQVYHQELEFQNEELRRVTLNLEAEKNRFRDLFENAPTAYAIYNEDFELIQVNRAFYRLTGLDRPEMEKLKLNEILAPESQDPFYFHLRNLKKHGQAAPCEVELRRSPGAKFVKIESNLIQTDGAYLVRSSFIDLTQDHLQAEALARSEALFRGILEQSVEGFFLVDLQGLVREWNPAMGQLTGVSRKEALDRQVLSLMHLLGEPGALADRGVTPGPGELKDFLQFLVNSGQKWTGDWVLKNRAGRRLQVITTLYPMVLEKETLLGGLVRDVTEAREMEYRLLQARKTEALGLLVGGLAHDFNNALGVILGRVDLVLQKPDLTQEIRDPLEAAKRSAEYSGGLTQKLLAYAKKQVVNPEIFVFDEFIDQWIQDHPKKNHPQVPLKFSPGAQEKKVHLDPIQLDRILKDLWQNAVEASGTSTQVEISTGFEPSQGQLILRFKDRGPGMAPEVKERIFDPFFTTKNREKNPGLGLPAVLGIVTQSNGTIQVNSEPGKGTEVIIRFPEAQASVTEFKPALHRSIPKVDFQVLVVEDEPEILEVSLLALAQKGISCRGCTTAEEALDLVKNQKITVQMLLTDVILPGKNGRVLAFELQALVPELRVLYMSGYTADFFHERGGAQSPLHFLQKPFTVDQLVRKVQEVLNN